MSCILGIESLRLSHYRSNGDIYLVEPLRCRLVYCAKLRNISIHTQKPPYPEFLEILQIFEPAQGIP